jgi:hypothetical protein
LKPGENYWNVGLETSKENLENVENGRDPEENAWKPGFERSKKH